MSTSDPERQGAPGASAHARAAAIRRRREQRAAQRSTPARVVRLLSGPTAAEKRSAAAERRWSVGAKGEEMMAAEIARRCPQVAVLHDLRVPGTRANIDHVAIAPTGVFVIDTKRYRGRIRVRSTLFSGQRLIIAGRDKTKLVEGLQRQVELIREILADGGLGDVAVHGCLGFVRPDGLLGDVGLPMLRVLQIDGCPLYDSRRLCKRLAAQGPLTSEVAEALHGLLQSRLGRRRR
jgi:Nuclease-related domain